VRFGGHAAAAGLTLKKNDFQRFSAAFEAVCRELMSEAELDRVIETDGELPADAFALEVAEKFERQVWGQGFPPPLFQGEFRVVEQRIVGERHLRLKLTNPHGQVLEAMRFQHADPLPQRIAAVYKIGVNEFRGERVLQLQIEHCEHA
jgi:single-stranded-DNA-specific exonuclease